MQSSTVEYDGSTAIFVAWLKVDHIQHKGLLRNRRPVTIGGTLVT